MPDPSLEVQKLRLISARRQLCGANKALRRVPTTDGRTEVIAHVRAALCALEQELTATFPNWRLGSDGGV